MRVRLRDVLLRRAGDPQFVFMTGDLGFNTLEPLRDAMGPRFVNAGVAEQNMISVAAGLAKEGMDVWVYSIAPFCYARPFEQIRNDICLHGLPVRLVGNGGGYAYGVMGPTHHALEDYGVLSALPGMHSYLPVFDDDIDPIAEHLNGVAGPVYLRLGRDESAPGWTPPLYAPWRRLLDGNGPVVVAAGPIAGSILPALDALPDASRPQLWVVSEFPVLTAEVPAELTAALSLGRPLCVIEEHVRHGGLGAMLCQWLMDRDLSVSRFRHLYARGYLSGRYGSQSFHRRESGLDPDAILNSLSELRA